MHNSQILQDLRTTRQSKGLRLQDLASGMLRTATISEIEAGKRLPRLKTRNQIESIIGPVSWEKTLAGDKEHLLYVLREFINPDQPGAKSRIAFTKQALTLIDEQINL